MKRSKRQPGSGFGLSVALALLVGSLAYLPFALSAELPGASHSDSAFAVQSAHGFVDGMAEGRLLPRWVPEANRGLGAPTFVYYSPGAYYVVAAASLVAASPIAALRTTALLLAIASGLSFALSARRWASPRASAIGAAIYMAAPYHVLDLYERFALAEFAAFVVIPPVFAAADRLLDGPSRRAWQVLALSYAALVLSHLVSAYLILYALGPYLLTRSAIERRWRRLLPVAGALTAGLACSAVYLLPVLLERNAVQIEHVSASAHFDWRRSVLFLDETERGYAKATVKPVVEAAVLGQLALTIGALITLGWRGARTGDAATSGMGSSKTTAWVVVAIASLALQTALTWPLWALSPGLATTQFPWRSASFQALAASVLAARALSSLAGASSKQSLPCLVGAAAAVLIALGLVAGARLDFGEARAKAIAQRTRPVYEYVPAGVPNRHALAEPRAAAPRAQLAGPGTLEIQHWAPHSRRIAYASELPNRLRIRTFVFPGWRATIDGETEPLAIEAAGRWRSIEVAVPAGTHEVEILFGTTPARLAGGALTTLALAVVVAWRPGSRRGGLLAALGLAASTLVGCEARSPQPPNNIVVLTLDTARRDHMSLYGYPRPTTPQLEALGEHAVVFENAIAQDTNTNPSHASMFTGLYPHVHGNLANGQVLAPGRTTLASLLRAQGFATAGFVSSSVLRSEGSGLDLGFEVYDDDFSRRRRPGGETVRRALEWLAQRRDDERFLLFVHLYDAHGPYRPPVALAEQFQSPRPHGALPLVPRYMKSFDERGQLLRHLSQFVDLYDAGLRQLDDLLGRLLSGVDFDDTIVVVLADHGETLGERYHGLDHGGQVFDEQVRIPFVLRVPGLGARRVSQLVETVDLLPTLLELLAVDAGPQDPPLQGRSLVPLLARPAEASGTELVAFSNARAVSARHGDRGYQLDPRRRIQSVRTTGWKLIRYPGFESDYYELYDLHRDPGEQHDLVTREPERARLLRDLLEQWAGDLVASAEPDDDLDPALRDQLRALGYVDEAGERVPADESDAARSTP